MNSMRMSCLAIILVATACGGGGSSSGGGGGGGGGGGDDGTIHHDPLTLTATVNGAPAQLNNVATSYSLDVHSGDIVRIDASRPVAFQELYSGARLDGASIRTELYWEGKVLYSASPPGSSGSLSVTIYTPPSAYQDAHVDIRVTEP